MKSSAVIRLIDVVLNLLFGFIAISEINRLSEINLPESTQIPLTNPDKEQILVIGISTLGEYMLDDEALIIEDIEEVKKYIARRKQELAVDDIKIRVRIRSDREAPAGFTFRLATICDELNVVKSIDVQRKTN